MSKARKLSSSVKPHKHPPVTFGVCATCGPRLDKASRGPDGLIHDVVKRL